MEGVTSIPLYFSNSFISFMSFLQVKELKNRVTDMEGQPRSSPGMTMLENKIQELEDQLRSEERYVMYRN